MKQGWEIKKLGDVCTIERGGSPRPIDAYITDEDNGINWIKIGDATPNSKYITSTKEKIKPEGIRKSRMVYKGDFILSNSMSFGRPYILGVDGCIHDGWLVLRDNENTFDKIFLYYYLSSPFIYQEFKRLAVGGVVNNLNSELVRGVNVIVPPIAEQEKIVAELDCLSGIIEKKKQQLKELDNLAQSIFYEMFGDPVENDKGWKVKKLGEVCDIINGFAFKSPLFVKDGDLILRISNIQDGYVDIEDVAHFNKVDYPKVDFERYAVHPNDIVVALSGATTGKLGINKTGKKLYLNQRVAICREKDEVLHRTYLLYYLMRQSASFLETAAGVAQPNLSTEQMKNYTMGIPPKNIQQHFASKIESIENQKELLAQSIKEAETLFNSRMDYYFN